MPRDEVIYIALQTVRAKEIYRALADDLLMPAAQNGALWELAGIISAALAAEIERRRRDGVE